MGSRVGELATQVERWQDPDKIPLSEISQFGRDIFPKVMLVVERAKHYLERKAIHKANKCDGHYMQLAQAHRKLKQAMRILEEGQ